MERIGIFCAASEDISEIYFEKAKEIGEWLGKMNKTIIYGGAKLGLMECIASSAKENGATLIGIIPEILKDKKLISDLPDKYIYTKNLSDRKNLLKKESEVLLALPGGIGTFDEIFHVAASGTIGYMKKNIILYNIDGFYQPLIEWLEELHKKGFIRQPIKEAFTIANSFKELTRLLEQPN